MIYIKLSALTELFQTTVEQLPLSAIERCEYMENVPEFGQLLLLFTSNNDETQNFHIFRTLDSNVSQVPLKIIPFLKVAFIGKLKLIFIQSICSA